MSEYKFINNESDLCEKFAQEGNLKKLIDCYNSGRNPLTANTFHEACINNNTEMMIWLHINKCPFDPWTAAIVGGKNGNLEILEWFLLNGYIIDDLTYAKACESGKIEVLEWLKEKNIKPDSNGFAATHASFAGHIYVLEWLITNNHIIEEHSTKNAAFGDQLETLKYLVYNHIPWSKNDCLKMAIRNKNNEMIEWIKLQ
ncbi:MAG: hypothetical protein O7C59_11965 [Rickettsia endosymbiont of Ixodes persulcatus]|nr:hypothetical protein [Rickettsia endosymbiont of Ixodes persulcatus]